jgi:hypothetical protein
MIIGLSLSYAVPAGAQTAQNNATQAPTQAAATTAPTEGTNPLKGVRFVGKLTMKLDTKHAKVDRRSWLKSRKT